MTTLTQPTLSILLDRLFAESDALEDVFRREMESLSPEQVLQQAQRMHS